jgi:hypothetical protein
MYIHPCDHPRKFRSHSRLNGAIIQLYKNQSPMQKRYLHFLWKFYYQVAKDSRPSMYNMLNKLLLIKFAVILKVLPSMIHAPSCYISKGQSRTICQHGSYFSAYDQVAHHFSSLHWTLLTFRGRTSLGDLQYLPKSVYTGVSSIPFRQYSRSSRSLPRGDGGNPLKSTAAGPSPLSLPPLPPLP